MIGVLIKWRNLNRHAHRRTHWKMKGRHWSDVFVSQRMPKIARITLEADRNGTDSLHGPQKDPTLLTL